MAAVMGLDSDSDMIAIAFVVDSSVALALQWPWIMSSYIMPMLRRIGETNPQSSKQFRAAFITYGTQGAPLVCKNFFSDLMMVIQVIREDLNKLGMGQTSCGGDMGMAALEGFVAALELFDILRQSPPSKNSPSAVYHIFHVAAAMPDTSERPQCNLSPVLDSVTWDSLPSEMKKRNIHLSSISTRPKLLKFTELHSNSSLVPPWFSVRPQDTVLLAGYTALQQKGVKRPGDPMTTTPDPKRAKISPPNTNSPKTTQTSPVPARVKTPATAPTPTPLAPMRIPTPATAPPLTNNPMVPPPAAPGPTSVPAPVPPPTGPPNPMQFPQQRLLQIQNALRQTEQPVLALKAAITDARAKGDTQTVENLMVQFTEKNNVYLKLKANIQAMLAQQRAAYAHAQQMMATQQGQAALANANANAQNAQQGQHVGLGQPPNQQGQGLGQQMQQMHPGRQVPHPPGPSQIGQIDQGSVGQDDMQMPGPDNSGFGNPMMQSSSSQPPPPPQSLPTQDSPSLGHMRSLSGGGAGPGQSPRNNMMPMNMNPGPMATSPLINQQMQKMIEQKERARQNTAAIKQNSMPVWQGLMTWSGVNPAGGAREVSSFVIASSPSREACHAETWPKSLTVSFTEKPAVSIRDLQVWMKRVEPVLCTFRANPLAENAVHNEMAYKALVAMLIQKNLYYVASWTLPNGKHSNNVLFFPVHNAGLVGAFFPLNGIPEFPQELPGNNPPSIIPNPTPPANPAAAAPAPNPFPPQLTAATGAQLVQQLNTILTTNGVVAPPAFIASLAKMNPAERNVVMLKIIRTGLEQRKQKAAAAAAAAGGVPPGGMGAGGSNVPPGMGMPMGMMQQMGQQMGQQQQQQQQHMQNQQQQQQQSDGMGGFNNGQFGLGAGMGDGGMTGGGMFPHNMGLQRTAGNGGAVSYEMMQSFMLRNQELGGGGS
ncbi:hypothetical protein C8F04DRAFT_1091448 [Mycena alexandri]|uniref:Mediator of RNA polymerase II transcription subunit 25 von Willebrand factor type A domain-containing protein n=1 Tax=Mycena alexandri TaxID=1745969 RepID=A0AAD6X6Y2_9AGAR|nr:hypothetical protein C8F04DRAFT_1091448 [Mycena alexandri]